MDRTPTRDFMVGVFVLAGILALAYLSISIGGISWPGGRELKLSAGFDEIGGLAVGAPVVISGVRVGEVSRISLDNGYRARVDLDLQGDLKLPDDTTASIVTSGMLGDRYISLQLGGDDKLLKSGDRITMTESAVILERLLGQLVYGVTKSSGDSSSTRPAATAAAPKLQ
ncbi:MAG TPA: outer membrane lipid asymmetry maintenance protein MlaD [Phycisphaerae bacterium]|nr:outer membrane lipid asymmetry maintenance protein MlaD [Phycisphaerae bacterium]